MTKPIVLTFVSYYLPGYKSGGPIRTIVNMVEHLGDEMDFRIVTSDRDEGDSVTYPGIEANRWYTVDGADVYYCSPQRRSLRAFAKLIRETPHDILYLNSFFSVRFTSLPLLARRLKLIPDRPVVVAPRGEFSLGALRIKGWKKRLYVRLVKALRLYANVLWQASSEYEADDIRRVMEPQADHIRVALNLPPLNAEIGVQGGQESETEIGKPVLRIIFLSRVSPNKNLHFALRVLRHVRARVRFNIYGPIQDAVYWKRCKSEMMSLPENIIVEYHGEVPNTAVPGLMGAHDLFFLPTLGENYGHVIAEALSAGTPVLIADTTPWRGLLDAGVGWDLPLDRVEGFAECIDKCASLDTVEYQSWRHKVREYARQRLADPEVVEANRQLFLGAVRRLRKIRGSPARTL